MAPQQNSTLIDENLEKCPSLSDMPEEIIRYSPILPLKSKANLYKNNNNNLYQHKDVNLIPQMEHFEREKRDHKKYIHNRMANNQSGYSRRSRSISLYGVNGTSSTMEQGHKEITIWLGEEPRYVSGVTNKTTCNDIIKALIDDEISNGNHEYCQRLKDETASRDYSDYVITECWRGIERSYDGNMAILPVWKAWSRVHNEIRLSLKHHKDIQDPTKLLKTNTTLSSIRKYIFKLLSFGKNKRCKTNSKKINISPAKFGSDKPKRIKKENFLKKDEFSSYPTKQQYEIKEKNSNVKTKCEETAFVNKTKLNREKLYKLSETRSSIRKRRSSRRHKENKSVAVNRNVNNVADVNNFIRKRKDSSLRSSVRNKLAQKNAEINDLYEREYALTKKLTSKCKTYKLHNELYTSAGNNLELSVGQIQRNIEACAKDIIQTEHELLEIKNEIKHDISIVNNLKRLTLDTDINQFNVPNKDIAKDLKDENPTEPTANTNENIQKHPCEQMQFVDNIYEFCDNNASMLV